MSTRSKLFIGGLVFVVSGVILGVGIAVVWRNSITHRDMIGPAALNVTADQLKDTIITSHLEQELIEGKNVLWCATAQIAWNELCNLAGEDIHLENEPPMVGILNKKSVTGDDLDEASYVAMAGMVEDGILEEIEEALAEKFQGQARPELLPASGSVPPGPLAYSYLFKSLPFEWAFDRLEGLLRFRGAEVECFGIFLYSEYQENEVKAASQMLIYDYGDKNDFIVELKTRSKDDRLFLAKVPPKTTLAATAVEVQKHVQQNRPVEMEECMSFVVPVLDFDIIREYSELYGKPIQSGNPRFNGLPFGPAMQQIRFKLDEKGAVLKSEAVLPPPGGGRPLIFNKPFLIMIQRKGAKMPYFALWVENAELLVPFDKTEQRGRKQTGEREGHTRYRPLIEAVKIGDLGYAKQLLAEGEDPNLTDRHRRSPLSYAIQGGREEIVKLLLDNGADPNRKDSSGATSLHEAARNGYPEIVTMLLDSGVEPDVADDSGETPLYTAALHGRENAVRILLDNGADATAKDHRGRTALHWAASDNHLEIVEMLLNSGADVNARDEHDDTPLSELIRSYHKDVAKVAKLLLTHGADPNISNKSGYTVLAGALRRKDLKLAKLLKAHGGKE